MHYVRCISIAFLVATLTVVAGCESKKEKPPAGPAVSTDNKTVSPPVPVQNSPAAVSASEKDKADARTAAQHTLVQLDAGDFAAVYREASAGFKKIGSEPAFINKFQQTRLKTGVLKAPKEISFVTRPGSVHVLVYRVQNERFVTDMRLSYQRGPNGTMELAGLNQHDEPRK
jgi:hypothetical protein